MSLPIVYLSTIETEKSKLKFLGAFQLKSDAIASIQKELIDQKLLCGLCKTCELSWPCTCQFEECDCATCRVSDFKEMTLEQLSFVNVCDGATFKILELEIE